MSSPQNKQMQESLKGDETASPNLNTAERGNLGREDYDPHPQWEKYESIDNFDWNNYPDLMVHHDGGDIGTIPLFYEPASGHNNLPIIANSPQYIEALPQTQQPASQFDEFNELSQYLLGQEVGSDDLFYTTLDTNDHGTIANSGGISQDSGLTTTYQSTTGLGQASGSATAQTVGPTAAFQPPQQNIAGQVNPQNVQPRPIPWEERPPTTPRTDDKCWRCIKRTVSQPTKRVNKAQTLDGICLRCVIGRMRAIAPPPVRQRMPGVTFRHAISMLFDYGYDPAHPNNVHWSQWCNKSTDPYMPDTDYWIQEFIDAMCTEYLDGQITDEAGRNKFYLAKQKQFNGNSAVESQNPTQRYAQVWFTARCTLLYHEAVSFQTRTARIYPRGGDSDGYGRPENYPFETRLRHMVDMLKVNKLIAIWIIEGKGVRAFVECPLRFDRRKCLNKKGNARKNRSNQDNDDGPGDDDDSGEDYDQDHGNDNNDGDDEDDDGEDGDDGNEDGNGNFFEDAIEKPKQAPRGKGKTKRTESSPAKAKTTTKKVKRTASKAKKPTIASASRPRKRKAAPSKTPQGESTPRSPSPSFEDQMFSPEMPSNLSGYPQPRRGIGLRGGAGAFNVMESDSLGTTQPDANHFTLQNDPSLQQNQYMQSAMYPQFPYMYETDQRSAIGAVASGEHAGTGWTVPTAPMSDQHSATPLPGWRDQNGIRLDQPPYNTGGSQLRTSHATATDRGKGKARDWERDFNLEL